MTPQMESGKPTVGEALVGLLANYGVELIFGIPSTHSIEAAHDRDMTQIAYTAVDYLSLERPNSWLHPNGYGTLGYALPAAIGVRQQNPDFIALALSCGWQARIVESLPAPGAELRDALANPACVLSSPAPALPTSPPRWGEAYMDSLPMLVISPLNEPDPGAIPQLEMAAADNGPALVLRHLQSFNEADVALLKRFARDGALRLFLQPGGLDTVKSRWPEPPEPLYYRLGDYGLVLRFGPTDFIQVKGPALVLRHLQSFNEADVALLKRFARDGALRLFLQPGGLDTVKSRWPETPEPLYYRLGDYGLVLRFGPTDFIQVNGQVNELMINRAMALLNPGPADSVLDLFCGLGNFTLPIARSGARVLGVEGDAELTGRGAENAALNGLANAEFRCMDLHRQGMDAPPIDQKIEKVLLDPPRSGAAEVVKQLIPAIRPRVIVYVSCNPATLARDANVLCHAQGYRMTHAGIIDMFPHTARVESVARFER